MAAVAELANNVGTSAACQALCMPRASYYRDRRRISSPVVTASRPSPARALHQVEREVVLSRLHEERFQDRSPAAVYATLLDGRSRNHVCTQPPPRIRTSGIPASGSCLR